MAAIAAVWSKRPQSPPNCQVPNAMRDTANPVRPNMMVFIPTSI